MEDNSGTRTRSIGRSPSAGESELASEVDLPEEDAADAAEAETQPPKPIEPIAEEANKEVTVEQVLAALPSYTFRHYPQVREQMSKEESPWALIRKLPKRMRGEAAGADALRPRLPEHPAGEPSGEALSSQVLEKVKNVYAHPSARDWGENVALDVKLAHPDWEVAFMIAANSGRPGGAVGETVYDNVSQRVAPGQGYVNAHHFANGIPPGHEEGSMTNWLLTATRQFAVIDGVLSREAFNNPYAHVDRPEAMTQIFQKAIDGRWGMSQRSGFETVQDVVYVDIADEGFIAFAGKSKQALEQELRKEGAANQRLLKSGGTYGDAWTVTGMQITRRETDPAKVAAEEKGARQFSFQVPIAEASAGAFTFTYVAGPNCSTRASVERGWRDSGSSMFRTLNTVSGPFGALGMVTLDRPPKIDYPKGPAPDFDEKGAQVSWKQVVVERQVITQGRKGRSGRFMDTHFCEIDIFRGEEAFQAARRGIKAALRAAAFSWIEEDIDVGIVAGLTTGIYAGLHGERVRAQFLSMLREVMDEIVGSSPTTGDPIRVIDYFQEVYYPIPPIFLPKDVQDAMAADASVGAVPEPLAVSFLYVPLAEIPQPPPRPPGLGPAPVPSQAPEQTQINTAVTPGAQAS